MKEYKIARDNLEEIHTLIDELDNLLTERISDLHEIKGMMQSRHAYIFYRERLWQIRGKMRESVKG